LCRGFFDPQYVKLASKERWIKKATSARLSKVDVGPTHDRIDEPDRSRVSQSATPRYVKLALKAKVDQKRER
jgi:hypothetical protein